MHNNSPELAPTPELPKPFTEFVLKIHSDICNLACDYCYEYEYNDDWKNMPPVMSSSVLRQTAARLREHTDGFGHDEIRVVLHGGEPFMAREEGSNNDEYLRMALSTFRDQFETSTCKLYMSLETNGLLLTDEKIKILKEYDNPDKGMGVRVGLSFDGTRLAHDLHRKDRAGRGSSSRTLRAASRLQASGLGWGFVGVIDTQSDPIECMETMAAYNPHSITMHMTHANHTSPRNQPPGAMSPGEWQATQFDYVARWHDFHPGEQEQPFGTPLMDNYLVTSIGGKSTHERVGNRYPQELFIITDGSYQRLDTLKTTEQGAYRTNYNIFDHPVEALMHDPGFIARRMGLAALAEECRDCPFVKPCGGGYYPTRYLQPALPLGPQSTPENFLEAFQHPSVDCADQKVYLGSIAMFIEDQEGLPRGAISGIDPEKLLERRVPEAIPDDLLDAIRQESFRRKETIPRQRKQSHEENDGSLLQTARSAIEHDLARTNNLYSAYPLPVRIPSHDIPYGDIPDDMLAELVQEQYDKITDQTYTGRYALHVGQRLHQLSESRVFYQGKGHGNVTSRLLHAPMDRWNHTTPPFKSQPVRQDMHLSEDFNAAILDALFHPGQPFLENVAFEVAQRAGFWLITENAVQAYLSQPDAAQKRYVTGVHIPAHHIRDDPAHPEKPTINAGQHDDWNISRSITVDLYDAPRDLLLVGNSKPNATAGDVLQSFKTVLTRLDDFANPQQLSEAFTAEGSTTTLRPLCDKWPTNFGVQLGHLSAWQPRKQQAPKQSKRTTGALYSRHAHSPERFGERLAIIRPAEVNANDLRNILEINFASLTSDYVNGKDVTREYWVHKWTEEWLDKKVANLRRLIESSNSAVHVAEVNGAVVGYALTDGDRCSGTYVAAEHQQRGIEFGLITQVLRTIEQAGHAEAWVGVAEFSKKIQNFYRQCGFESTHKEVISRQITTLRPDTPAVFKDIKMQLDDVNYAREAVCERLGFAPVRPDNPLTITLESAVGQRAQPWRLKTLDRYFGGARS